MIAVYLLDTDTLSLLQRGHPVVTANVATHAADDVLGLTAVTIEEQVTGWLASLRKARTPADQAKASRFSVRLVASWTGFPVVPMTEPAIGRHEQLVRLRLNVGGYDLRIAAIALEAGATVVTRNRRDFGRVPGLTVVDWSA